MLMGYHCILLPLLPIICELVKNNVKYLKKHIMYTNCIISKLMTVAESSIKQRYWLLNTQVNFHVQVQVLKGSDYLYFIWNDYSGINILCFCIMAKCTWIHHSNDIQHLMRHYWINLSKLTFILNQVSTRTKFQLLFSIMNKLSIPLKMRSCFWG